MRDLKHELEWQAYCLAERLDRTMKSLSEDRFSYRLITGAITAPFLPALLLSQVMFSKTRSARDIVETFCNGYIEFANWIIFGRTDWRGCDRIDYISTTEE